MTPLLDRNGLPVRRGNRDWLLSDDQATALHNARLVEPMFRGRSRAVVTAWVLAPGTTLSAVHAALRGPQGARLPVPPPTAERDPDLHIGYRHARRCWWWGER